jgi:hypothetical protein
MVRSPLIWDLPGSFLWPPTQVAYRKLNQNVAISSAYMQDKGNHPWSQFHIHIDPEY